ncbi:ABC transporter permease [Heyndrickxia acidicola]|uniref:Putative hemin transport system permease protein HrtB n=1 Tax=Heyndrickxia acidicola TaxID=209389 RepID=A0ABU6MKW5_9BACI|nr:ABC transporter permease [Heyndrickxia acidicola]MED1205332.1 ABC transporter permease [Heyndrickxia acidicola]
MFLSIREFKYAKLRYLLVSCIMVLIALLVLFVSGLAKGLSSDNASSIQNMNADYLVLQHGSDHRLNRSILPEHAFDNVRRELGKKDAAPLNVQMGSITKSRTAKKLDATFFAIDARSMIAPKITEGKNLSLDTMSEVVADQALKKNGIRLGDTIQDQVSGKHFTIVGFTKGQSFSHSPVIHINLNEWKSMNHSTDVNAIAIKADSAMAKKISSTVSGVEVISKKEALKGIPGYQEEQGSLIMMIAFLFIIAAFVLAVFFYVITIQKINQFGVLKAIGAKSGYIARTIIAQIFLLTLASLFIAICLAYGLSYLLPDGMPFDLSVQLVLGCSILFIFVSLLGSLLSLYRVTKIDAIEAIGRAA